MHARERYTLNYLPVFKTNPNAYPQVISPPLQGPLHNIGICRGDILLAYNPSLPTSGIIGINMRGNKDISKKLRIATAKTHNVTLLMQRGDTNQTPPPPDLIIPITFRIINAHPIRAYARKTIKSLAASHHLKSCIKKGLTNREQINNKRYSIRYDAILAACEGILDHLTHTHIQTKPALSSQATISATLSLGIIPSSPHTLLRGNNRSYKAKQLKRFLKSNHHPSHLHKSIHNPHTKTYEPTHPSFPFHHSGKSSSRLGCLCCNKSNVYCTPTHITLGECALTHAPHLNVPMHIAYIISILQIGSIYMYLPTIQSLGLTHPLDKSAPIISTHLANKQLLIISPHSGHPLAPRSLSIYSTPTNMLIPETYIITMAKITKLSNPLNHPCTCKTAELIIETIKRYPVNPSPIGLGDFTLPPPIIFWLEETYGLTHQKGYYPLTLTPNPNLKPTLIASPTYPITKSSGPTPMARGNIRPKGMEKHYTHNITHPRTSNL